MDEIGTVQENRGAMTASRGCNLCLYLSSVLAERDAPVMLSDWWALGRRSTTWALPLTHRADTTAAKGLRVLCRADSGPLCWNPSCPAPLTVSFSRKFGPKVFFLAEQTLFSPPRGWGALDCAPINMGV